jgi:hypothetical protein
MFFLERKNQRTFGLGVYAGLGHLRLVAEAFCCFLSKEQALLP